MIALCYMPCHDNVILRATDAEFYMQNFETNFNEFP
jgi:hypothetical protein